MRASESLGPGQFAWVALHFELYCLLAFCVADVEDMGHGSHVFMTFATAKAHLFCIVAHEGYSLARVTRCTTEVAGFYPHAWWWPM